MNIPCYQVDAFTDRIFSGNPAAVCLLAGWLDDALMQAIAAENALSETAFMVREGDGYGLRWFTPQIEVDLCGHATLAAAHVLFEHFGLRADSVRFHSRSGELIVRRRGDLLVMDFPARPPEPIGVPGELAEALGAAPASAGKSRDLFAVFDTEEEVLALRPDMDRVARLDCLGVIATAPGRDCDFVSRFFAPSAGIPEDPVTGSAHCTLIPYWARRLGKNELHGRQVSRRGGELFCADRGERVEIGGRAVTFASAFLHV